VDIRFISCLCSPGRACHRKGIPLGGHSTGRDFHREGFPMVAGPLIGRLPCFCCLRSLSLTLCRGAVALDGRIEPGDMILEVNGISFENMTNDDAVRALREAVQHPG